MNVVGWLFNFPSTNRMVRYVLRVAAFWLHHGKIGLSSHYVRTFNSNLNDYITRAEAERVHGHMVARGFEKVDLLDSWEVVMRRGYVHRALLWGQLGGESNRVAMQLSERRLHRRAPRSLNPAPLLDG